MPKTYITNELKIKSRFTAWIYGQLKTKNMKQYELADKMGITQAALNRKLRLDRYTFEDFIIITGVFDASIEDMVWLAGRKGE